jgi:hypothetical protein
MVLLDKAMPVDLAALLLESETVVEAVVLGD